MSSGGAILEVRGLSAQRIRHELDLILDEARAKDMLRRLAEFELLRAIHPSLTYDDAAATRLRLADQAPALAVPAMPRRGPGMCRIRRS